MDTTAILLGGIAALATAVSFLFGLLLREKDGRLKEKDEQLASYKSMLEGALFAGDEAIRRLASLTGVAAPKALAPVVPEHASPVTVKQLAIARVATHRARVVAMYKYLDLEPRKLDDVVKSTDVK